MKVAERMGRSTMKAQFYLGPSSKTSNHLQEQNSWPLEKFTTSYRGRYALAVRPSTKLVAVAIVQFAGSTSGLAWPSLATIAATTGLSRRQVVYAIHELEAGGHLAVTRLKIGKKNASNRYPSTTDGTVHR